MHCCTHPRIAVVIIGLMIGAGTGQSFCGRPLCAVCVLECFRPSPQTTSIMLLRALDPSRFLRLRSRLVALPARYECLIWDRVPFQVCLVWNIPIPHPVNSAHPSHHLHIPCAFSNPSDLCCKPVNSVPRLVFFRYLCQSRVCHTSRTKKSPHQFHHLILTFAPHHSLRDPSHSALLAPRRAVPMVAKMTTTMATAASK